MAVNSFTGHWEVIVVNCVGYLNNFTYIQLLYANKRLYKIKIIEEFVYISPLTVAVTLTFQDFQVSG